MEGVLFPRGVPEGREGLEQYRARGGYRALEEALKNPPERLIQMVSDAGLRGRGGAGFPTGKKWQFTREAPGEPRYLVLNGGEDERLWRGGWSRARRIERAGCTAKRRRSGERPPAWCGGVRSCRVPT